MTYLAETQVELEATAESAASLSVENLRDVERDRNGCRRSQARCPSVDKMTTKHCCVGKLHVKLSNYFYVQCRLYSGSEMSQLSR